MNFPFFCFFGSAKTVQKKPGKTMGTKRALHLIGFSLRFSQHLVGGYRSILQNYRFGRFNEIRTTMLSLNRSYTSEVVN